jgi:hypothetical protein
MKENSTNNCNFFLKFIISVAGGQCDYLPRGRTTLDISLGIGDV